MQFTCAPELAAIVRAGAALLDGVVVAARSESLDAALARAETTLRTMAEPAPALSAVRAMYHRLGIDPTRTRPSSEALWRRIRKGDRLPAINAPVDVANWCSVETQLPFGLYDLDGLRGPIALRRGRAGEAYAGIRKDVVHVEGRMTLADDDGPFGNPTSDSARTMVTRGTRRVMVVIFAPAACEIGVLDHALTLTASRMQAHAGAVETARFVVDAGGRGSGVTEE